MSGCSPSVEAAAAPDFGLEAPGSVLTHGQKGDHHICTKFSNHIEEVNQNHSPCTDSW